MLNASSFNQLTNCWDDHMVSPKPGFRLLSPIFCNLLVAGAI